MSLPEFIKIVEVGPRDGLQNEPKLVPADVKVELINRLSNSGLPSVEVTSFVSPKWIPQIADNTEVLRRIKKLPGVHYPVLVPNARGFHDALAAGVREVAIFGSASESFSQRNINCSIDESFERFEKVVNLAVQHGLKYRGYVSCVVGCPYEGDIDPEHTAKVVKRYFDLGCYEVSLGDTIGVSTPIKTQKLLEAVGKHSSLDKVAGHFHDTYGQALVNVLTSIQMGVTTFDSSVGGLGGCPYAKGATGNVATEDLVYMLHGMGIETGVSLEKLVDTGHFISSFLEVPNRSRASTALYHKMMADAEKLAT